MNYEKVRNLNDSGVIRFKIFPQNYPADTEEDHENLQ
jgi:hypothetical protein